MPQDRFLFRRGRPIWVVPIWVVLCLMVTASRCGADDWPQILGPHRNGVVDNGQMGDSLPSRPNVLWRHKVGQGYAGPAVVGRQVFVFHRVEDNERVEAIDRETGAVNWSTDFLAVYRGGFNSDNGPRCVPLVHQGKVIVFGAAGDAHAVDARSGKKQWSRELYADYRANDGYFGAGSTPIAVGDRVLFNVGGPDGAGLAALSIADGRTLWTATDEGASYSSPTTVARDGRSLVVFVTRYNAVGVDPATGDVRFRYPFGQRGPTVNAATPLTFENRLFLTASYGIGAVLLKQGDQQVSPIWKNDRSLSSQYNTPIYYRRHLFGIHGREDVGRGELRCVEAETGRVVWSKRDFGVASLNLVGNQLIALTSEGELVMIQATPEGYNEVSRLTVSRNTTRALPAYSDGFVFLRDNRGNAGELICLDLKQ